VAHDVVAQSARAGGISRAGMRRGRAGGAGRAGARAGARGAGLAVRGTPFDRMLDYMEGGPKLRRWYGKDSSTGRQDGQRAAEEGGVGEAGREPEPEPEPGRGGRPEEDGGDLAGPPSCVFVPDCEGELGMAVVLKLILTRQNVRLLVRDKERFEREFGPYCDCVQGEASDLDAVAAALRGVRAVVAPGALSPGLAEALYKARRAGGGPDLLVLPSTAGRGTARGGVWSSFQRLVGGADASLSEADREKVARNLGVPYCILNSAEVAFMSRGGRLGGGQEQQGIAFSQKGAATGDAAKIAVDDFAAACCAAAAFHTPAKGTTVWLGNSPSADRLEQKNDWVRKFDELQEDSA